MYNINKDARLKYSTYGNGKAIIEILNIGFEPLLTEDEYEIYKTIGELKYQMESCNISISLIKSKIMYCNTEDGYYSWLKGHLEQQEQKVNELKETKKNKGDEFHNKLETNKTIIRNSLYV